MRRSLPVLCVVFLSVSRTSKVEARGATASVRSAAAHLQHDAASARPYLIALTHWVSVAFLSASKETRSLLPWSGGGALHAIGDGKWEKGGELILPNLT